MLITALTFGARIKQFGAEKELTQIIEGGYKEHVIGIEGALATGAYIYNNWLKALDYVVIRIGGDSGDLGLGKYVIDVKTRSESWHDLLMIPKKQWLRRTYDFYIGCNKITEEDVRIWGYITREQLEKKGKSGNFGYGDTLYIPFVELTDIREIKKFLERSKQATLD
jgi:hypothetical protein